jgi:hypothetical protein
MGVRQMYNNPQPPQYVVFDAAGRVIDFVMIPNDETVVGFTNSHLYTGQYAGRQLTLRTYSY